MNTRADLEDRLEALRLAKYNLDYVETGSMREYLKRSHLLLDGIRKIEKQLEAMDSEAAA